MKSMLELRRRAKAHYPHSVHCQRQWLRKTAYLYASGKHALQTGGWKNGARP